MERKKERKKERSREENKIHKEKKEKGRERYDNIQIRGKFSEMENIVV